METLKRAVARMQSGASDEAKRDLTAIHEAAHALVSWVLGVPVERVTANEDFAAARGDHLGGFTERRSGTWRENAKVAAAGLVAHNRIVEAGVFVDPPRHDVNALLEFLFYAADGAEEDEQQRLYGAVCSEVDELLQSRAEEWDAVADALTKWDCLDGGDLEKLLGPTAEPDAELAAARRAAQLEINAGKPRLRAARKG